MARSPVPRPHRGAQRRTLVVLVVCLFAAVVATGCDQGWSYSAVNDSNAAVTIEAHLHRTLSFVLPAHSWAYVDSELGDFDRSWTIGTVDAVCQPVGTLAVNRPEEVLYVAPDGQLSFSDGYLPPYEYGLRTATEITPDYTHPTCPIP